mmetsp:Transcript_40889/g.66293  ORF Transcript_40889/g.66293 Transcript_40889/m.66293 type:complete len:207 (+) Transcript_40889:221-841(+)
MEESCYADLPDLPAAWAADAHYFAHLVQLEASEDVWRSNAGPVETSPLEECDASASPVPDSSSSNTESDDEYLDIFFGTQGVSSFIGFDGDDEILVPCSSIDGRSCSPCSSVSSYRVPVVSPRSETVSSPLNVSRCSSSSKPVSAVICIRYSEEDRKERVRRYLEKRERRRARKNIKHIRYACRKQAASLRPRVKGRFVKVDRNDC